VIPTCERFGLGQIVFSPLAQGLLTGKYAGGRVPPESRAADEARGQFLRPHLTEKNLGTADRIAARARSFSLTPAQAALAFVLRQPSVSSAIVGATAPEQLEETLAAADLELPESLATELDSMTQEHVNRSG